MAVAMGNGEGKLEEQTFFFFKKKKKKNSGKKETPLPKNINSLLFIYLLYIFGFIYIKIKN